MPLPLEICDDDACWEKAGELSRSLQWVRYFVIYCRTAGDKDIFLLGVSTHNKHSSLIPYLEKGMMEKACWKKHLTASLLCRVCLQKKKKYPTHSINLVWRNSRLSLSYVPSLFLFTLQPVILCSTPRYWCECQVVKESFNTSFLQVDVTFPVSD